MIGIQKHYTDKTKWDHINIFFYYFDEYFLYNVTFFPLNPLYESSRGNLLSKLMLILPGYNIQVVNAFANSIKTPRKIKEGANFC